MTGIGHEISFVGGPDKPAIKEVLGEILEEHGVIIYCEGFRWKMTDLASGMLLRSYDSPAAAGADAKAERARADEYISTNPKYLGRYTYTDICAIHDKLVKETEDESADSN